MEAALAVDPRAVVFRPAGAEDLPVLTGLYLEMAEAHGEGLVPADVSAKLRKMLAAPGQQAVLFEAGGEPVGFCVWADLGDHVFVRNYCITKMLRGAGLGAGIWSRLRAEILPAKPARLEVSAAHAEAFWTSQGFAPWSTGMRDARAVTPPPPQPIRRGDAC